MKTTATFMALGNGNRKDALAKKCGVIFSVL